MIWTDWKSRKKNCYFLSLINYVGLHWLLLIFTRAVCEYFSTRSVAYHYAPTVSNRPLFLLNYFICSMSLVMNILTYILIFPVHVHIGRQTMGVEPTASRDLLWHSGSVGSTGGGRAKSARSKSTHLHQRRIAIEVWLSYALFYQPWTTYSHLFHKTNVMCTHWCPFSNAILHISYVLQILGRLKTMSWYQ